MIGFFIVHFVDLRQDYILPALWIKNIQSQYEKFVNKSLNRSQISLCYFTNKPNAFDVDNRPNPNWKPKFMSLIRETPQGEFEGCFYGSLKHFKLHFEDAVKWIRDHRVNIPPGLYNLQRLRELPIPNVELEEDDEQPIVAIPNTLVEQNENGHVEDELPEQNNPNEDQHINNNDETEYDIAVIGINAVSVNENDPLLIDGNDIKPDALVLFNNNDQLLDNFLVDEEVSSEQSTSFIEENNEQRIVAISNVSMEQNEMNNDEIAIENELAELDNQVAVTSIDSGSGNENDPLSNNEHDAKSDALASFTNNGQLLNNSLVGEGVSHVSVQPSTFVEEPCDEDGDVFILIGENGIPKPQAECARELFKRENDEMSGEIPFDEKENGDRIYQIGNDLVVVPAKVTKQIIKWNKNNGDSIMFDKKVFGSLVLSLSKQEDLDAASIRQEVMDFIKACFIVRYGNTIDRIDSIEMYKDDLLKLLSA